MVMLAMEPLDMTFSAGAERARSDQVGCQVDKKADDGIDELKKDDISLTEETVVRR